jgi:protein-tyrosine phosphatase
VRNLLNIHTFYWEDHKTPEFEKLFDICEIMMQHLLKDVKNVCVVHCNHGKGRTGTLICCFHDLCWLLLKCWGCYEILLEAEVLKIRVWGYTTLPN